MSSLGWVECVTRFYNKIVDGINSNGSLTTKSELPNVFGYGIIYVSGTKIDGSGVTFEADNLVNGATTHDESTGGMYIDISAGTRELQIRTDADAGYITLWVGGVPGTGTPYPLTGGDTVDTFKMAFDDITGDYGLQPHVSYDNGLTAASGTYLDVLVLARVD